MPTKDFFGESDDLIKKEVVGGQSLARLSMRDFPLLFSLGKILKNY